jgi:hypothetical protein
VKEGKLAADQRLFNGKRMVRDLTFVANVATVVASDRLVSNNLLRLMAC